MHWRRVAVAAAGAQIAHAGRVSAHGGGLASAATERLAIPTWLFLATGGGVVAASFLLSTLVTDRGFVARLHAWRRPVALPTNSLAAVGRVIGLLGLAVVVVAGLLGPATPTANVAVLLVWVGWWSGLVAATYLVGDAWPALDPFRALARPLATGRVDYPDSLGRWPATVGVLGLAWLEVASPVAERPRALAGVVIAYAVVAVLVAAVFGRDVWVERVDPVSALFALFGRVGVVGEADGSPTGGRIGAEAPPSRPDGGRGAGQALRVPGSGLVGYLPTDAATVGLVVALVWATTFDGLVRTPQWAALARDVVAGGVPGVVLYPLALVVGYLLFLGAFLGACRWAGSLAPTHVATGGLARAFAPSLLPIAAGYHLAHVAGSLVALAPALVSAVGSPVAGGSGATLGLPAWFGGVAVAAVLAGHLLAIWVAHGVAFARFPGRLQALRSQYAVTAAMVGYTMVSLWIVTRPHVAPPFL